MNHDRCSHWFLGAATRLNDAATPYPLAVPPADPSLIACPALPTMMLTVQDIYRIAYENALAATLTSRFDLVMRACPN